MCAYICLHSASCAGLEPPEFTKGGLVKGGLAMDVLSLYDYCLTPLYETPLCELPRALAGGAVEAVVVGRGALAGI